MFEEPPSDPEWHVADDSELTAEEQAEWLALAGGWTQEHMLAQRIAEGRAAATRLAAEQYAVIDELRLEAERTTGACWSKRDALAWRELRAEVAGVLQVHERTADRMLDVARELVHRFPETLAALGRAEFTDRHARIVVDEAVGLPDELAAEYERRVLPYARTLVPARLEAMAATIRAQLRPEDLAQRHQEALEDRRIAVERGRDGMAGFSVYLSAEK